MARRTGLLIITTLLTAANLTPVAAVSSQAVGGAGAGLEGNRSQREAAAVAAGQPAAISVAEAPGTVRWIPAYTYNLYRSTAFSTQKTFTWCIAAGVQMMRNYVKGESDHSSTTQKKYYDYARAHDRFPNDRFVGSDAQGWAAAATTYTGVAYTVRVATAYRTALRTAALRMRTTRRPVGMMVARGGHAWIMNGFRATADPLKVATFEVTDVYISGPLYPIQQSGGYDRPPNTRFSYEYLKQFFLPFRSLPGENSEIWDQKFLTVTP